MPHAIAFVFGFGWVFTLLGVTAYVAGGPLLDNLPLLRQIGGIVLIILGLNLMGVIRIPVLSRTFKPGQPQFGQPAFGWRRGAQPARCVRPGHGVRDRLDAVHRAHPGRHPSALGNRGQRAGSSCY